MKPKIIAAALFLFSADAHAQPAMLNCDRAREPEWCRISQSQIRRDWPKAGSDHQAMRNIAYCLWNGCDNAIMTDRASSCVIRRKIISMFPGRDPNDGSWISICANAGL